MKQFKEGDKVLVNGVIEMLDRDGEPARIKVGEDGYVWIEEIDQLIPAAIIPASALDVNKELLEACKEVHELVLKIAYLKGNVLQVAQRKREIALDASHTLERAIRRANYAIAAAEKGA